MVEVLLESGGQEVAVAESESRSNTPIECMPEDSVVSLDSTDRLTPIQQFYDGQSVFVTGATGFLGKLLIEKLLRKCLGIVCIYILVRPKKGKDVHQRTDELFDDPVFEKLKEEQPKFRHRIIAIEGDCSQVNLGISAMNKATLIREVSIVFHAAATLRFDEKMKLAVTVNVLAPKIVIHLCKEMTRLKAFVHVSTAYANCQEKMIEEKFYDTPMDPDKLIDLINCMDEKLIGDITNQILGKWPNTYTFTKAIAEHVVKNEASDLPAGIFRPAIVISTYREPIRGWIDNLYGPTGFAAGAGTGLIHTLHCDGSIKANVVPGDLTINALISTAWDVANLRSHSKDIPIYNYVSKDNPLSYYELKHLSEKYGMNFPTVKAIWYYSFEYTKYRALHVIYMYLMHLFPALLFDAVTLCMGKRPRLLKIYKKIHKFMDVLNYFTTNEWSFSNDRLRSLINAQSPEDQNLFLCDMKEVDWEFFFQTYLRGIRIFLIKDPIDTLAQGMVKWQRLYWMHQALKLVLVYVFLRISWAIISTVLYTCGYV